MIYYIINCCFRFVYLVMECISGGELFTHLRREKKFTDEQAKFYGATIAQCFDYMHSKNIVHRWELTVVLDPAETYSRIGLSWNLQSY